MSRSLNLKSLAALAALVLPVVHANPISNVSKRQDPLTGAVPACSSELESRFQPAFDFDTDSCYNAPAVDGDGNVNPGRDTCEIEDPGDASICRQPSYLDNNNVYVRSRTNNGWTAQLWGYYFETDAKGTCSGHRHDWEHVVVWIEGDTVRYVAASAHGDYDVRPIDEVLQVNGHPKIVYHKDGGSTHAMRFAKEDDDIPVENHSGDWFFGGIVDYYGFPSTEVRDSMLNNDWGDGKIDFKDDRFAEALDKAKGGNDIPLDTGVDDEGTTSRPC